MVVDTTYETHISNDTSYRLIPSPDAAPGSGYKFGAVLQWKDRHQKEWQDYFFVSPESLADVGEMFQKASEDIQ